MVAAAVVAESGRIEAVEEVETASTDVILPAFVNAHTHLGDSVAKEAATGLSLDDAVAPPDSLIRSCVTIFSHRCSVSASRAETQPL